MKTYTKIALGALLAGTASAPALAQASASAAAASSVEILSPIAITTTSNLGFGKVVRPTTGTTTVTVDPGGTRSLSGSDGVEVGTVGVSAAVFHITGTPSTGISVTVPTTPLVLDNNGPTVTLTPAGTSVALIDSSGKWDFPVGGSFDMTSTSATGGHSGIFTVTASYN